MIEEVTWLSQKCAEELGVPVNRQPDIAAFIAAAFLVGAASKSNEVSLPVTFKSLKDVLTEYDNALGRMATDALKNKFGKVDFRRAHKQMLRTLGPRAFEQGWLEGGGDVAEMEPEDLVVLRDWVEEQIGFVNDFALWLAQTDDSPAAREELITRIDLWVDSMRNLGQIAKARAEGDPMLLFDGDDGKDSCDECIEYTGQTHRLSWWDKRGLVKRNGNDNYGCGRFGNCQHHFYNPKTLAMVIA